MDKAQGSYDETQWLSILSKLDGHGQGLESLISGREEGSYASIAPELRTRGSVTVALMHASWPRCHPIDEPRKNYKEGRKRAIIPYSSHLSPRTSTLGILSLSPATISIMGSSGIRRLYSQVVSPAAKSTQGPNATTLVSGLVPSGPSTGPSTPPPRLVASSSGTIPPPPTLPQSWPPEAAALIQDTRVISDHDGSPPQQGSRLKAKTGKGKPQRRFPTKPEAGETDEGSKQQAGNAPMNTNTHPTPVTSPASPPDQQIGEDTTHDDATEAPSEPTLSPVEMDDSWVPSSASPTTTMVSLPTSPPERHCTCASSNGRVERPLSDLKGSAPCGSARELYRYQPGVSVLIDGDQLPIESKYLLDGADGGAKFARALKKGVKGVYPHCPEINLSVEISWNQGGLRRTYELNGYPVTHKHMASFAHGFQRDPRWAVTDRGYAKEGVDRRVMALVHDNLRSPYTDKIILGFSKDRGYITELGALLDEACEQKIVILKGRTNFTPKPPFDCEILEIPGLFMEDGLPDRHQVAFEKKHTGPPDTPIWGGDKLGTPSTASFNTQPTGQADLHENWRSNSGNPQGGLPGSIPWKLRPLPQTPAAVVLAGPRARLSPLMLHDVPLESPTSVATKKVRSAPGSHSEDAGSNCPASVPLAVVYREHGYICPSVDQTNRAFATSSCVGGPVCHFHHECPYGAECVLNELGACNFAQGMAEGTAVEVANRSTLTPAPFAKT